MQFSFQIVLKEKSQSLFLYDIMTGFILDKRTDLSGEENTNVGLYFYTIGSKNRTVLIQTVKV
jgi:hypothetical protein